MAQPTITGYTIVDLLGSGGFASVYLATATDTDEQYAIKVLHDHTSNPDDLRRFERERTTMRALSGHPNIVGVFDDGQTDDGQHYTVLEFVGGGSVRDRINSGGALHWANVVEIGVQICAALDVAHRSGVLHRDVKPANILLDDDMAKLTDFGIARLIGQSQVTAAQSIIGTLAYTPPEVFHNKPFDGRGDIYQLGVSLYEMLLGRAPFTSAAADNKATIIRRILDHPAPPLAQFDVPQALSDLLDEVLAKDPADRPQSAETFGRRLNEVEAELGRTPTHIGSETQSIELDTATITDPNAASTPGEHGNLWPAAATDAAASLGAPASDSAPPTFSVAPEAPVVEPPADADITVVEPRPTGQTSVIASTPPMSLGTAGPAPSSYDDKPAPPPTTPAATQAAAAAAASAPTPPTRPRRWPWVALVAALIGAAAAGVGVAQLTNDGDNGVAEPSDDDPVDDDPVDDDPPARTPQFAVLDDPAFAQPSGSDGVIFDAVSNNFGLTMVGAAGDGETVSDQRPVVWTIEPGTVKMQRDFSGMKGRLWSIGIDNGTRFLAVGDAPGDGDTDGIAMAGINGGQLTPTTSDDFMGVAKDQLRASVLDRGASDGSFLVGGSRTLNGVAQMTIWDVSPASTGSALTWTPADLPTTLGTDGVINDIATNDTVAVAVGRETVEDADRGVILIRRAGTWAKLIEGHPDAEFNAVTISGDRIIAVGVEGPSNARTPFAIVSDATGLAWYHQLPIRGSSGNVRDVAVVGGSVIAVGDVAGESDSDGAIWEMLGAETLQGDKWTTRATPDLQQPGFTELWSINEFDGTIYIFGRTEDGDRRPAGAWTLDLSE